jgi:hypothetical protein
MVIVSNYGNYVLCIIYKSLSVGKKKIFQVNKQCSSKLNTILKSVTLKQRDVLM